MKDELVEVTQEEAVQGWRSAWGYQVKPAPHNPDADVPVGLPPRYTIEHHSDANPPPKPNWHHVKRQSKQASQRGRSCGQHVRRPGDRNASTGCDLLGL